MRCVVSSCDHDSSSPSGKNITFFIYPTEPLHRAAWMEALYKAGLQPGENAVVCADHFLSGTLTKNNSGTYELQGGAIPFLDMQVCRICFATNEKLYAITKYKTLYEAYESLTGLLVETVDKLPPYLCTECANRVLNGACFRIKSIQAHLRLSELVQHHCITVESIQSATELCVPLWTELIDNCSDYCDLNIKLIQKDSNILTDEQEGDAGHLSDFCKDTLNEIKMEVDEEMHEINVEREDHGNKVADINELDNLHKQVTDRRDNIENIESVPGVAIEECVNNSEIVFTSNLHQDDVGKSIDLRGTDIVNKDEQDVVVEEKADNFSDVVSRYNFYQNIIIERIKTENEKEIEQDIVVGKSSAIDGFIAESSLHEGIVEDRVKPEFDEQNDQRDLEACAHINSTVDILPNTSEEIAGDHGMSENQEEMEQSLYVEKNTINVGDTDRCSSSSSHVGSADYCVNARYDEQLNQDAVTAVGIDGSTVPLTTHIDTVGDDQVAVYVTKEELINNIENIGPAALEGEASEEIGTEINEEIKECIALEEDASKIDSVIGSQEKSCDTRVCIGDNEDFIIYHNIGDGNNTIGFLSSNYIKINVDSAETGSQDVGNEESCNNIEQKPLTDEVPSLAGRLDSEAVKQSIDPPEVLNSTAVAGDRRAGTDYEILLQDKFSCETCNFETGSEIQLLTHLKAHASTKFYNCDICSYKTIHNHSLQIHLLVHSGKKSYTCDVCKRRFSRKSHLRSHLSVIHADEKPYLCDVCKSSFSNKSKIKRHMQIHFSTNVYACKVCKKAFSRKEHFKIHRRVHSGARPNSCDVCERSFSSKDDLKNHLVSHSGKKPYECDVCQKAYSYKRNLKQHARVHSAESPFPCEVCGRPFRHKHTLKHHLRTHSGGKPYSCPKCEKAFIRKDSLQNHLLTHSEEKEISCKICNELFSLKRDLQRHLLEHSGKKVYSCHVCYKEFHRPYNLRRHMSLHSNKNP